MRTYFKYLSRNKLYTFVSVMGFGVSLMFVIILGFYAKNELTVDNIHKKADRIFMMRSEEQSALSNPTPAYIRNLLPEVESFCRVLSSNILVKTFNNEAVSIKELLADSTFFSLFDFPLIAGNRHEVLRLHNSVVLTATAAKKLFGDENAIGKTIPLHGENFTVTGLMKPIPNNSQFPKVDCIVNYNAITLTRGKEILENWGNCSFTAYFLMKPGTNVHAKEKFLEETFKKDERTWIYKNGFQKEVHFVPLRKCYFDPKVTAGTYDIQKNDPTKVKVITGIVFLILIIAMLNYINMTVAQAGFRGKEAAIRRLHGSSRSELIRRFLRESLVMTAISFAVGLLLAFLMEPFFERVLDTRLDLIHQFTPAVIVVALLFVLLLSVLAGILPAVIISRFRPIEIVKGTFRYRVKSIYSKVLIVFQYTVSVGLLICSFFMLLQTRFLMYTDLGFRTQGILWINNQMDSVSQALLRTELMKIPDVDMVTFCAGEPLRYNNNLSFSKNGEAVSSWEMAVDTCFFKFFEIEPQPLTAEPIEVIFEKGAQVRETKIVPTYGNAKMINVVQPDPVTNMYTQHEQSELRYWMVGKMPDIKFKPLTMEQPPLQVRPLYRNEYPWATLVRVKDSADKTVVRHQIMETYKRAGNLTMADDPMWAKDIIKQRYTNQSNLSQLITAFAVLTMFIMIMGVFAMSLYMIRQKEKEIAVRKVNGATESIILRMLNLESLKRLGIALVIAVPVSYWAMKRWLETFVYHIDLSWWVFVLAALIVILLSLLSTSAQSLKAARANPVKYLKNE
ncbi:ABC transporter permease [Porphyromonas macacae]|uniref:ABC transporter permease n=1 Tax=Porphyromonas macacae TaxID=28115 RepID=UPI00052CF106|nr:ABC transporter permease [Porphyromonas macacae]KGN99985.1 ABC transporter permease [Porphyromonas macacae]